MPFYCCVPGCTVKKVCMYTFPIKDKEVFDIWVKRISNPKFEQLADENICKSYRICPKHFTDECKIPGSRKLKFYSLPTLNVPGFLDEPNTENSFHFTYCRPGEIREYVAVDHCYATGKNDQTMDTDNINISVGNESNRKRRRVSENSNNPDEPPVRDNSTMCYLSNSNNDMQNSLDHITSICLKSNSVSPVLYQSCTTEPHHIKYLIENYNEPIIFNNLNDWNILQWTLEDWGAKLGDEKLIFRKNNFIKSKEPLWEQTCKLVEMTLEEFIETQSKQSKDSWFYFDYKYMAEWFKKHPDILQDVSWQRFGYPEMSGKDSTIWIGTEGAHTSCHKDSYGCNLIAQIYGRKKWILFPPEENLKPTRVPYEESSVYSQLNLFTPNLKDFDCINKSRTVTLNPGEVLFLPHGWWHYVENIETAISVNVWIPQPEDQRARVEEAFTQLFVAQMTKELMDDEKCQILNPNSNEITDMPISYCLNTLEHVVKECQKQNQLKSDYKLLED
ncbi:HSPB1 associated protein 1 [Carabus blaptoides fortunei]